MGPKKGEAPTRKQPHRNAKTPPEPPSTVPPAPKVTTGRVTKPKPAKKSPRKPRAAAEAAAKALKDAAATSSADNDDSMDDAEGEYVEPASESGASEAPPAAKKQKVAAAKSTASRKSKDKAPAEAIPTKEEAEDQPDMDEAANPYKDTETMDYPLKPADIKRGTIISLGMHDQYSRPLGYDAEYEARCVREAGDKCGLVSSKYRKFVIIGVHEEHFVTLPIYTSYIGAKTRRNNDRIHASNRHEHADILDESLRKRLPPVPGRAQPTGRGRVHGGSGFLWSKEAAVNVAVTNWRRMDDSATVMLSRPVCFNKWARCKVLSALDAPSLTMVLRWAREEFEVGLGVAAGK